MRFFRDFFTENLPGFLGVAGKSPHSAARGKGGADTRQRSLTPNAAPWRDGKVLVENLHVARAKAPIDLSSRLLIHASHESPPPEVIAYRKPGVRTPRAERIQV